MQAPTTPRWRLLRGATLAAVATELAALGHVVGGGALPDPAVLVTVGVFVGGAAASVATRRRSGLQIFGVLAASQLLFHAAFAATAHHGGPVDAGRMLAFHVLSAVIASWLLAGGDATLFGLFTMLRRTLRTLRTTPAIGLPPGWTAVLVEGQGALRLRTARFARTRRRGPPPSQLPA